ncbi:MAG: substrate-binding domain-containing protein, partial [Chloroflexota bacterium]|nr:substrate-binding domain-containing protein [Chloroflexota bacterium]
ANAEAGFVALSLAVAAPDVTYVLVDASLHQPIRQALAVVAATKHEDLARRFIVLLTGPQGRAILEKYGFSVSKEE